MFQLRTKKKTLWSLCFWFVKFQSLAVPLRSHMPGGEVAPSKQEVKHEFEKTGVGVMGVYVLFMHTWQRLMCVWRLPAFRVVGTGFLIEKKKHNKHHRSVLIKCATKANKEKQIRSSPQQKKTVLLPCWWIFTPTPFNILTSDPTKGCSYQY